MQRPETNESPFLSKIKYLLPYLLFSLPVIASFQQPFFWDTIQLGSRHAHFFYESRFNSLFLPNDIDSGHIPIFGIYLAMIWTLFGRSLIASHLAMLPFVLGAVYFTSRLVDRLFASRYCWLITCLILCDATILAQFTLVSPDIWMVCFFSMALFAMSGENRLLLAFAILGLALTSMRGMMVSAALFFAGWFYATIVANKNLLLREITSESVKYALRMIPSFLPAAIISAAYLGAHYLRTGWIGYHTEMPWYDHFVKVDFYGFMRNVAITGWRFADHGRVFIWITALLLLIATIRKKIKTDAPGKWLLTLSFFLIAALSYSGLVHKNLAGHRYYIPIFFITSLTVVYHLFKVMKPGKQLVAVMLILTLGMISGNFWVYPDRIAKGWDAFLAYVPYNGLRQRMLEYIEQQKIDFEQVATDFPNNVPVKFIDLNNDHRSFSRLEGEMGQFRYVFYSNVFNGFTDQQIKELNSTWKPVKTIRKGQVKVILFENPD